MGDPNKICVRASVYMHKSMVAGSYLEQINLLLPSSSIQVTDNSIIQKEKKQIQSR